MNYSLLIPEYCLVGLAFLVIAVELWFPQVRKDIVGYIAALGAAGILAGSFAYAETDESFGGLFQIDHYTLFFRVLFLGAAVFICILSAQFVRKFLRNGGEYYGVLLLGTAGAIGLAAATELLTAYISLELISFSLYVLISFAKYDRKSNEAGLKYVLLGAFSSAMFLYGVSLVYGVTKTTSYVGIAQSLPAAGNLGFLMGIVLILTGVGFKIAAVPFHMATPDAYEGAPLPITAFLSITSKAAGFALLLRLFSTAFGPRVDEWKWLVAILSAATMTLGNLIAIQQYNIKRLLAYSSIGQVGYLLIGIAALAPDAASALLFHLAGYIITNLVVFGAVIAIYNQTGIDEIPDYAGMADRQPFLALVLTIGLFSLAGMPLFAGFFTKFFLFQAGANHDLLWLVGFGVVNSMISLYYYLLVIKQLYLAGDKSPSARVHPSPVLAGAIGLLTLGVFFVGIYPMPLVKGTDKAIAPLFPNGSIAQHVSPAHAPNTGSDAQVR
jgi:NADH-quinone oxidoreductase subunit N